MSVPDSNMGTATRSRESLPGGVERLAGEAVAELAESLLSLYRNRSSTGMAGSHIMTLYLDAQKSLPARPQKALRLARKGLRILHNLLDPSGEDRDGNENHQVQKAGIQSRSRPPRSRGANLEGLEAQRERRIVSGNTHSLLMRLYEAGVRPRLTPGSPPVSPPKLTTAGRPLRFLPAPLIEEFLGSREELSELLVWDAGEARSLLAEAHEFVADRWLPGVKEPGEAPRLRKAIVRAGATQDMGALRVSLRNWVVAYVEEIDRVLTDHTSADRTSVYRASNKLPDSPGWTSFGLDEAQKTNTEEVVGA